MIRRRDRAGRSGVVRARRGGVRCACVASRARTARARDAAAAALRGAAMLLLLLRGRPPAVHSRSLRVSTSRAVCVPLPSSLQSAHRCSSRLLPPAAALSSLGAPAGGSAAPLAASRRLARGVRAPCVMLASLTASAAGVVCVVARPGSVARADAQQLQDWQARLPEAAPFKAPAEATAKPQGAASFFLEVILPDILLLLGAALASVGAAWSNVQISKLLGSLSDSIVKLGAQSTSGGDSVDRTAVSAAVAALAKPAFALLKAYTVQGALSALYISVMAFIGERLAQRLRKRM
jgi:hypothetical protein